MMQTFIVIDISPHTMNWYKKKIFQVCQPNRYHTLTCTHTHTHNQFMALWILSGTTRVRRYWKKHSPNRYQKLKNCCGCQNYNYNHFMAPWTVSGSTRVSWHQKDKTNLDLLEQKIVSGSGISLAICKFAPRPREITMPVPHHSVFYRPDALPATQPTSSKH